MTTPDLKVTDADLDTVRARLDDAAVSTLELACMATFGIGSDVVEAAYGEVDPLVANVARALATAAAAASASAAEAADVLEQSDKNLAKEPV